MRGGQQRCNIFPGNVLFWCLFFFYSRPPCGVVCGAVLWQHHRCRCCYNRACRSCRSYHHHRHRPEERVSHVRWPTTTAVTFVRCSRQRKRSVLVADRPTNVWYAACCFDGCGFLWFSWVRCCALMPPRKSSTCSRSGGFYVVL